MQDEMVNLYRKTGLTAWGTPRENFRSDSFKSNLWHLLLLLQSQSLNFALVYHAPQKLSKSPHGLHVKRCFWRRCPLMVMPGHSPDVAWEAASDGSVGMATSLMTPWRCWASVCRKCALLSVAMGAVRCMGWVSRVG